MQARKARVLGTALVAFGLLTACHSFGSASSGSSAAGASVAGTSLVAPTASASVAPPSSVGPPPATAQAQPVGGYRAYTNPRFGFTCNVPAGFSPGEEPANGDGLGFSGPDGAQVICSGVNNALDETVQQDFADSLKAAADDGSTVTYQRLGGDAFTVSGTTSTGTIFYEHTAWGPGSEVTVSWTYPAALKDQLDAAVTHSVKTLQPGDLSTGH